MTEPEYLEEPEDEIPPNLEDYYCTHCAWRGLNPEWDYDTEHDAHNARCPRCDKADGIYPIDTLRADVVVCLRADHVLALLTRDKKGATDDE